MEKLIVNELNFYFGFTQILKNINLELQENKIISIVGASGGVKTT